MNRYFASRLLTWMPKRIFQLNISCPRSACTGHLNSAGFYQRMRRVLDIDGYYNLAAEYLECSHCKKKKISWSSCVVQQLDLGHCVLLTYRLACDIRVVTELRQWGLGNSVAQTQKKLAERHGDQYYRQVTRYLEDCKKVRDSVGVLSKPFQDVPLMPVLSTPRWLLTAYCQDVQTRLVEVKSAITSVFGNVLKLDSTKKIVRKLAGHAAGTAAWATNVGKSMARYSSVF